MTGSGVKAAKSHKPRWLKEAVLVILVVVVEIMQQ